MLENVCEWICYLIQIFSMNVIYVKEILEIMFFMLKNIKCLYVYCRKFVDIVYILFEVIIFREEVYFCDFVNNVLFFI